MPRALPDVATCTWLEAEQAAEVLEAVADEMRKMIGPPLRGMRANARRQGKQSMMIFCDSRALSYRLRQYRLRAGDW